VCVDSVLGSCELSDFPEKDLNVMRWASRAAALTLWKRRFSIYPKGCDPVEVWMRLINADSIERNGRICSMNEEV
jgi:hypothetical protein